jgi:uncharacterized protein YjeT (DUF2065 family)
LLNFSDLFAAFALVFVLDGIITFVNPRGLKRVLTKIQDCKDQELRIAGLLSMLVGLTILFLARG